MADTPWALRLTSTVTVLVVLAACDTAPPDPVTGTTPAPATSSLETAGAETVVPVTAQTGPADLLLRTDDLPEGVPEQAQIFEGGDARCPEPAGGPPRVVVTYPEQEIPAQVGLCFDGFDPDAPLEVTVTPPAGAPVRSAADPPLGEGDLFYLLFPLLPGAPEGDYRVTAAQGGRTAAGKLTARLADEARVLFTGPDGAGIHLHLGGFPPGRETTLHLYGPPDEPVARRHDPYRTSFRVAVDARGEAHYVIPVGPESADRCFRILGDDLPTPKGDRGTNAFCLWPR
ncbi:hypothetical protein Q0Z83_025300 [Actinoplanes sichuanensis]|uniref:Uncharacterized protein n=1 Tax=Actinoplanes sichuanensis TaxID=512349 RepID=A0ABW4A1K4_9ACTN|nr:hypothetical protein [Actinoplanes sichuanensis]BEL04339.1 hypothetical protein Q0Z83_025300 [Actinoplanes sichuanensis]